MYSCDVAAASGPRSLERRFDDRILRLLPIIDLRLVLEEGHLEVSGLALIADQVE